MLTLGHSIISSSFSGVRPYFFCYIVWLCGIHDRSWCIHHNLFPTWANYSSTCSFHTFSSRSIYSVLLPEHIFFQKYGFLHFFRPPSMWTCFCWVSSRCSLVIHRMLRRYSSTNSFWVRVETGHSVSFSSKISGSKSLSVISRAKHLHNTFSSKLLLDFSASFGTSHSNSSWVFVSMGSRESASAAKFSSPAVCTAVGAYSSSNNLQCVVR